MGSPAAGPEAGAPTSATDGVGPAAAVAAAPQLRRGQQEQQQQSAAAPAASAAAAAAAGPAATSPGASGSSSSTTTTTTSGSSSHRPWFRRLEPVTDRLFRLLPEFCRDLVQDKQRQVLYIERQLQVGAARAGGGGRGEGSGGEGGWGARPRNHTRPVTIHLPTCTPTHLPAHPPTRAAQRKLYNEYRSQVREIEPQLRERGRR